MIPHEGGGKKVSYQEHLTKINLQWYMDTLEVMG
jgi:hypothetical protein